MLRTNYALYLWFCEGESDYKKVNQCFTKLLYTMSCYVTVTPMTSIDFLWFTIQININITLVDTNKNKLIFYFQANKTTQETAVQN